MTIIKEHPILTTIVTILLSLLMFFSIDYFGGYVNEDIASECKITDKYDEVRRWTSKDSDGNIKHHRATDYYLVLDGYGRQTVSYFTYRKHVVGEWIPVHLKSRVGRITKQTYAHNEFGW